MTSETSPQGKAPHLSPAINWSPPLERATEAEKKERRKSMSFFRSPFGQTPNKTASVASTVQAQQATSPTSPKSALRSEKPKKGSKIVQNFKKVFTSSKEAPETKPKELKKVETKDAKKIVEYHEKIVEPLIKSTIEFLNTDIKFIKSNSKENVVSYYKNDPKLRDGFLDKIIKINNDLMNVLEFIKLHQTFFHMKLHEICDYYTLSLDLKETRTVLKELLSTSSAGKAMDILEKINPIFQLNIDTRTIAINSNVEAAKPKRVIHHKLINDNDSWQSQGSIRGLSSTEIEAFKKENGISDGFALDIVQREVPATIPSKDFFVNEDKTGDETTDGVEDFDASIVEEEFDVLEESLDAVEDLEEEPISESSVIIKSDAELESLQKVAETVKELDEILEELHNVQPQEFPSSNSLLPQALPRVESDQPLGKHIVQDLKTLDSPASDSLRSRYEGAKFNETTDSPLEAQPEQNLQSLDTQVPKSIRRIFNLKKGKESPKETNAPTETSLETQTSTEIKKKKTVTFDENITIRIVDNLEQTNTTEESEKENVPPGINEKVEHIKEIKEERKETVKERLARFENQDKAQVTSSQPPVASNQPKKEEGVAKKAFTSLDVLTKKVPIKRNVEVLDSDGKKIKSQAPSQVKASAPVSPPRKVNSPAAISRQELLKKAQAPNKEHIVSHIFSDGCINNSLLATVALGASMVFAACVSMAMK